MYFPCTDKDRELKQYHSDVINGDPVVSELCKGIRSTQETLRPWGDKPRDLCCLWR